MLEVDALARHQDKFDSRVDAQPSNIQEETRWHLLLRLRHHFIVKEKMPSLSSWNTLSSSPSLVLRAWRCFLGHRETQEEERSLDGCRLREATRQPSSWFLRRRMRLETSPKFLEHSLFISKPCLKGLEMLPGSSRDPGRREKESWEQGTRQPFFS